MNFISKSICILMAGTLLFGASACKKQQTTDPKPTPRAKDDSWETIIQKGQLDVSLTGDGLVCVPESSTTPPDFATALISQISERLGIPLSIQLDAPEQAKEKIKNGTSDLTFGVKDEALGCSKTVLEIDGTEYCLMYRKEDLEFSDLLNLTLQSMANDDLLSQLSIEFFEHDFTAIPSQIDTGLPSEEEAEEYDARLKEK